MRKPSLSQIVYCALYPKLRTNDPTSFAIHTAKHIVPEVRHETATFYGALDCIEAQYPGLDYNNPAHRMRLSRFTHHKRLFKIFDDLGLTEDEIASLCRWEGTKWARERYQRDAGIVVRDTTADEVTPASARRAATVYVHPIQPRPTSNPPCRDVEEPADQDNIDTEMYAEMMYREEEENSDDDMESYGVALNQRLLEAAAARERGVNVSLDEEWEQWLKEAVEHGRYADMISAIRSGEPVEMALGPMPLPPAAPSGTTSTVRASENPSSLAATTPGNRNSTQSYIYDRLLAPRQAMDSTRGPNAGAAR